MTECGHLDVLKKASKLGLPPLKITKTGLEIRTGRLRVDPKLLNYLPLSGVHRP